MTKKLIKANSPCLVVFLVLLFAGPVFASNFPWDKRPDEQNQGESASFPKNFVAMKEGPSLKSSGNLFPGKRWKVIERCGNEKWEGIWKREGQTNIFEARWSYLIDGVLQPKEFEDMIELKSVANGKVILYRYGLKGYYEGRISKNKEDIDIVGGDASWYSKGCYWTAEIEY
jgi:hypothetical protein